jgi:hypothetical protein
MAHNDEYDRTSWTERDPSYPSYSGYDWSRRRGNDGFRGRGVGGRHWGYGREDLDTWRRDDHYVEERSYSPDRRPDQRDYDDTYEGRPSKRRRGNSRLPSPSHQPRQSRSNSRSPIPRQSRQLQSPSSHPKRSNKALPPQEEVFKNKLLRLLLEDKSRSLLPPPPPPPPRSTQFRSPSPYPKRPKAPLPSQEKTSRNDNLVTSKWNDFYTRARAIRNKNSCGRDLKEPVDLFNDSTTTSDAIDKIFEEIEKEEPYNFPKDDDPTLRAACEALSHALQKANENMAEHDTPEVKQALDSLRKAYDEAAKSNIVPMRYVDIEPPLYPFSPLNPLHSLGRVLLPRSWVKELITKAYKKEVDRRVLVVGQPGAGESLGLLYL